MQNLRQKWALLCTLQGTFMTIRQSENCVFQRGLVVFQCRIWTSYKTENFAFFYHLNLQLSLDICYDFKVAQIHSFLLWCFLWCLGGRKGDGRVRYTLGYFQSDIHFIEDCIGSSLNCLFLTVHGQCGSECGERWTGGP